SPRFAEVLTPGDGYTGGRTFFEERLDLVKSIPPGDVPARGQPLHEAPESLLEALRLFFLGVAAGAVRDDRQGKRSMLVHPSQETASHKEFLDCVRHVKGRWERTFRLPEDDPDHQNLVEDFARSWAELRR